MDKDHSGNERDGACDGDAQRAGQPVRAPPYPKPPQRDGERCQHKRPQDRIVVIYVDPPER